MKFEGGMHAYSIRRVPWTCEWGRFGVTIAELYDGNSRVDDVFWGCRCPERGGGVRPTRRGECETCPFWKQAARLRTEA
jgi:hypothetical protein